MVHTDGGAARDSEKRRPHQCLELDQDRPRPFHAANNSGARNLKGSFREKKFRRVVYLLEPRLFHFEDPDLIGGTEAVFDGSQDAEVMSAVPLEIENRVDHMLQYPRAGE